MVFVMGLAVLVSWPVLSFYFRPFFHVYLSVIVLPFVLRIKSRNEKSNRFIYLSILLFIAFIFLKVHLLFFTGFCFLFLSIIETYWGKVNNLPIVLVLLMSPFTIYFLEIIGYPMRIQLASVATRLLQFIYADIQNQGNVIQLNGFEILVDKACAGLRMITTGLITAIAFSGIYERKTNTTLSFFSVITLLVVSFGTIVFANLIRIILLIVFQSAPETFGHELIGAIAYAAIILPILLGLTYVWVLFFGKEMVAKTSVGSKSFVFRNTLLLMVVALLLYVRFNYHDFKKQYKDPSFSKIEMTGFDKSILKNGVLKLNSENALIYLKPPQPFYSADHTPVVCWRGSGYTFKSEEITTVVNDFKVNTACLVNKNDTLYTAWFYDNTVSQTHSPFVWRWRQIKNEPAFRLVNITSPTKEDLICELIKFKNYDL
ncbi:MAG: exosortase N [Chitinophagales bacterium]